MHWDTKKSEAPIATFRKSQVSDSGIKLRIRRSRVTCMVMKRNSCPAASCALALKAVSIGDSRVSIHFSASFLRPSSIIELSAWKSFNSNILKNQNKPVIRLWHQYVHIKDANDHSRHCDSAITIKFAAMIDHSEISE